MIKCKLFILILFGLIYCTYTLAQQPEIATQGIFKAEPRFEKESKERIEISSYEEYSWVRQGSGKGHWNVSSNRLAYIEDNIPVFYTDFDIYTRFSEVDYTFNFGSYYKSETGYIHGEIGFGADVDYIYRFRMVGEAEFKLIDTLNINVDGIYMNYESGDVLVTSPGLVYYFGNDYIGADFGISIIKNRFPAYFGTLRGYHHLNEHLGIWFNGALGERLFDIFEYDPSKQFGFIVGCGMQFTFSKNFIVRAGWSHSEENPSFIKQSIDLKATIKF